nr:hypothetical protein [Pseudolysinimonas kribbensis]
MARVLLGDLDARRTREPPEPVQAGDVGGRGRLREHGRAAFEEGGGGLDVVLRRHGGEDERRLACEQGVEVVDHEAGELRVVTSRGRMPAQHRDRLEALGEGGRESQEGAGTESGADDREARAGGHEINTSISVPACGARAAVDVRRRPDRRRLSPCDS